MAIDHQIIGNADRTVFLHIGNTVIAVAFIKAPFQIIIRLVNGLHDRIVDVGSGNGYPTHKIAVLLLHGSISFISRNLRFLFMFRGLFFNIVFGVRHHIRLRHFRQCVLHHKGSDIVKGFGALLCICILAISHKAENKAEGGKHSRPDHQNDMLLHGNTSIHENSRHYACLNTPSPGLVVINS